MQSVAIIDLGMGNLASVRQALLRAAAELAGELEVVITGAPERILGADRLVMPGQGAFRTAAEVLGGGVGEALVERIRAGTPYLGICLGLQALFDGSDEAPDARGLGVLGGRVRRLDAESAPPRPPEVKIPHMGWNEVRPTEATPLTGPLATLRGEAPFFYFVHSYHAIPDDPSLIAGVADHGPFRVTAAVAHDNVVATQFHPEKSQRIGLALLHAFLAT